MKFEYHKDNLTLKVLNEKDTASVLNFYERNRVQFDHFETEKPANFYTKEFIRNLIKAEYNAFLHGKHVRFFLYDKSVSKEIIGSISFSDIKGNMQSCIVGYKIDQNFQNLGYGRRMLTMALRIMVEDFHMHRIEAYVLPENEPSKRLCNTLGFIPEGKAYAYAKIDGTWMDHERYVYIS